MALFWLQPTYLHSSPTKLDCKNEVVDQTEQQSNPEASPSQLATETESIALELIRVNIPDNHQINDYGHHF